MVIISYTPPSDINMANAKKLCDDCNRDTVKLNEHFFLNKEIWNSIHKSERGFLCIDCCEKRLGRLLTKDDFADVSINKPHRNQKMSMKLSSRLGYI